MNLDQSADKITPSTGALTVVGTVNSTNIPTTGTVLASTTAPATNPATGTPSSTTYLRGDGTWATPSASTTVTNDTTTATSIYPAMTASTSGSITGVSVTSTKLSFIPSTGALSSTSVVSSSDARLKDDVQPIANALDKVNQLQGVSYIRNDIDDKSRQIGLIAQEVEKIMPESVLTDEHGYKAIAYGNLVSLLIESVKELSAEVKELKAQLKAK